MAMNANVYNVCTALLEQNTLKCFCMIQSDRKSVKTDEEGEEHERQWVSHYTTWWGCSTVRTIVSLQRLWKDNREWSGLDNTTDSMVFEVLLRFISAISWLSLSCKRTVSSTGLCWCNASPTIRNSLFLLIHPLHPCPLYLHLPVLLVPWPSPPSLPPGTVKDVTLQGLWLSLGARRSPSPR